MKKIMIFLLAINIVAGCVNNENQKVNQGSKYKNKKIAWGFKKVENSPPGLPSEWICLLERFDGYYLGDKNKKSLFLTFDEGYENGYTPKILDVLKEQNVPAAFFVTGAYITKEADLVKRMADEGHIVGNHTYNHPSMPDVSNDEKLIREMDSVNEKYHALTGETMKYLRPPKGEFSERTLAITKKNGYKTILWSNAYVDWISGKNTEQYALESVTKYLHNGCIILMHAVSKENALALPKIVSYAREQGYTFESLDDL
ncbi:MAG: delta-lactam-biosynthetic de-N-acetylase [Clostridiaceae bacterium]|jgi:peptidoglycan-N-acetylmuramic acid deacetylase|nr:delta-lactam-biosynthetic de-N-acetylase [Clostridiaceae bacterium]